MSLEQPMYARKIVQSPSESVYRPEPTAPLRDGADHSAIPSLVRIARPTPVAPPPEIPPGVPVIYIPSRLGHKETFNKFNADMYTSGKQTPSKPLAFPPQAPTRAAAENARTVLQTLQDAGCPVQRNQIAVLAKIPPKKVESGIKHLLRQGKIKRSKRKGFWIAPDVADFNRVRKSAEQRQKERKQQIIDLIRGGCATRVALAEVLGVSQQVLGNIIRPMHKSGQIVLKTDGGISLGKSRNG